MTRSIVTGLFAMASVAAVAAFPIACQSGGVGDPCIPEDEYNPQFAGYKVTEENIESRSFQCKTRICLVNHFQGRVSCPLGQAPPTSCAGTGDNSCSDGAACVQSATFSPSCAKGEDCASGKCNAAGYCECDSAGDCPPDGNWSCDPMQGSGGPKICKSYVCHKKDNCQLDSGDEAGNKDKSCCVPGTDIPVAEPVCGQCADNSGRNADDSVYCSCRCGVADGEPDDPDFNFCECPTGFTCSEIRKNVGLGDKQITGKYCVKDGTEYTDAQKCGQVKGYFNSNQCKGIGL